MKHKDILKIKGIECKINYKPILEEYGEKTMNILKNVSPRSNRPNRTTPYWSGWTTDETKRRTGDRVTVWNETNWQLTHLLENGHFITNRIGGLAWAEANPHIRPTYRRVTPQFKRAMRKAEISFKIK